MSVISSDEEIGLYINLTLAITEFIFLLYNEIRNLDKYIIIDEIIMIIIGFLSYRKFFKNYKILRLVVLYLWNKELNRRVYIYRTKSFIWFDHFRTFAYLSVGLLPFIRGG